MSPLYAGGDTISKVYVGSDELSKIYVGSDEIWSAVPPFGSRIPEQDFSLGAVTTPQGLWSDGTTMWVSDGGSVDKIFAYNLATKARDASKDFNTLAAAGNQTPVGLWSDGTTMWVSDRNDTRIYAYDLATKGRASNRDFNSMDLDSDNVPYGLHSATGGVMYVSDPVFEPQIFAYLISTKEYLPSANFDASLLTAAGNTAPFGISSKGTETMWVADSTDGKIYAYTFNPRAREPDRDINTLSAAGNTQPGGLWSDGTTMWVIDTLDDKIYAYSIANPP